MRPATLQALRPAAFTRAVHRSSVGASPPARTRNPPRSARTVSTGARVASIAPPACACASNDSIRAWLSTMPVDGESNAASTSSAGSSAMTAAPSRRCRSSTPLVRARRSMAASSFDCAAPRATISLPVRRCGTARSVQKAYNCSRPWRHSRALRLPGA